MMDLRKHIIAKACPNDKRMDVRDEVLDRYACRTKADPVLEPDPEEQELRIVQVVSAIEDICSTHRQCDITHTKQEIVKTQTNQQNNILSRNSSSHGSTNGRHSDGDVQLLIPASRNTCISVCGNRERVTVVEDYHARVYNSKDYISDTDDDEDDKWDLVSQMPSRTDSLSSVCSITEEGVTPSIPQTEKETALAESGAVLYTATNAMAEQMLKNVGWNVNNAVYGLLAAQIEESHIHRRCILLPTTMPTGELQGMENGGNTCYIDSVLFACFAALDAFDSLLTTGDSEAQDNGNIRVLQDVLLRIINRLRSGELVSSMLMCSLLDTLHAMGWESDMHNQPMNTTKNKMHGISTHSQHSQQDAGELFLFLLEHLGGPLFPMVQDMVHGGMADSSDQRIIDERMLHVVVSCGGDSPTSLEALLEEHYFGINVLGVRRDVVDKMGDKVSQNVLALKILRTLPHYSSNNRTTCQQRIIIPICFSRYSFSDGTPRRVNRRVVIPISLDFSRFVRVDSQLPQSYSLELRSLVCHRGTSVHCGHYVSWVRTLTDEWVRFDDMASPRVQLMSVSQTSRFMDSSWATDAYILFFELTTLENVPKIKQRTIRNHRHSSLLPPPVDSSTKFSSLLERSTSELMDCSWVNIPNTNECQSGASDANEQILNCRTM
eukprot:CFRG3220T1